MKYVKIGLVAMVLGTAAFVLQRPDLASTIDESTALTTKSRANAADSGSTVDVANYACVALVVVAGQSDLTTTPKYVILQDSTPGTAAWNMIDSIAVDSTDNKSYDVGYKGFRRHVRALQRASGAAGDTIQTTGVFLKGCKRSR